MFASLVRYGGAAALLGVTAPAIAAQIVITGTVRIERGGPLSSAAVQVTGTSTGVLTNDDGRYRLVLRGEPDTSDSVTLVVRRIGYDRVTRRIAIRGNLASVDF
jgi:hypothetical protein